MEFWRYYRVLRQRRAIVIAAVLAAIVVGLVVSRPGFGDFSATATIEIPSAQRFFFVTGSQGGSNVPVQASPDVLARLATDIVRSSDVATRVIQQGHLGMSIGELQERIRVERELDGARIRVTAQGRTPQEAVGLANAVADAAVAYDQEVQRQQVTLAREFMEKQVADVSARLRSAEDALLAFQQTNGTVLVSGQGAQIGNLQAQMQQIDFSLQESNARLSAIAAQMNGQRSTRTDEMIADNPIAQQLRSRLVQLEVGLTSELAVHTEDHPNVVAIKSMIQAIRDRLNKEVSRIVLSQQVMHNPVYDALSQMRINAESDRLALLAKKEALQRAVAGATQAFPGFVEKQMGQARLSRTIEILGKEAADLQAQLAQVRLREQESQNLGNITVSDHARTATASPFQGIRFKLTLAAVFGLIGGIGLVFLLEYLDNALKSPEIAERLLGVPALAVIPRHNPPFDEAYRMLRVSLTARESPQAAAGEGADVIAVTSPRPGGGSSTVVANLARSFAQAGRRTIVVDGALRRPSQHKQFGLPHERGLADVLTGKAAISEVLAQTGMNLWVLPSGIDSSAETRSLLGSSAMSAILAELRRRADIVLVDTCPAGAFADVFALARLASGVLITVDGSQAPRSVEEQVKIQLERLGANVLGLVLTKVRCDLVDSYFYQERFYGEAPQRKLAPAAATAGLLVLVVAAGMLTGFSMSHKLDVIKKAPSMVTVPHVAKWVSSLRWY
jgi:polysaccharide biosynthesis transport protein